VTAPLVTPLPFSQLDGKCVVVTGASSGIGRAIALESARAGAAVVVHYRHSEARAAEVVEEIRALGRDALSRSADLSDTAQLAPFVEHACNWKGHVDGWVNNAGMDLLTGPAAAWTFEQKLQALWEVDVRGTVLLSRLIAKHWSTSGKVGAIVNIGWDQADRGMEGDSGELFATAKNAIMGFSRSLAVSLAPQGIRVNCLAPGWIKTAWGESASELWQQRVLRETPLQRWGAPEDIAAAARFLLSDDARYITGQVWNINGGAVR
jgi:3-oxoacyl-[acyl-carrier protein] reductase